MKKEEWLLLGFEMLVKDNNSQILYDISELVTEATWKTSVEVEQPGRMDFSFVNDERLNIGEGSAVSVKIDGIGYFYGYVFKEKYAETRICDFTAYDQMRYLKNKNFKVFTGQTADQIFSSICKEQELKHKVVTSSSHIVSPHRYDNESYYSMIQTGIDETLIYTNKWFMVRDNFGTLEFIDMDQLKTKLVLGDGSLVTGYSFEKSIDEETYNQIKLVKENKETLKREVYITKDSSTIGKYGLLQYFATVEEGVNEAQIEEKGKQLLKMMNRPTLKFSVEGIGYLPIRAGNGLYVDISDLYGVGVPKNSFALITACTHNYKNHAHTMNLTLRVVR